MERHTARCATNKAKLDYRECTRFSQGVQLHDVTRIKDQIPWTIACIERTVMPSSAITHEQSRRRWPRDQSRSRLQYEERDMWITVFSLALASAACFGVAAVVMAYSKRVARSSG